MGNAVTTRAYEGEICELLMISFGKFPEALAARALFLGEQNGPAWLLYEYYVLVYFYGCATGFLKRELFWFAGHTEVPDGATGTGRGMWRAV